MRTRIVAFLVGNISLLYWSYFPNIRLLLLLLILLFGLLLILSIILYKSRHHNVSLAATFLSISFLLVYFISGYLYTALSIEYALPALDLKELEGKTITIRGRIASIPYQTGKKQRFDVDIDARKRLDKHNNTPWDNSFSGKVRLSWYHSDRPLVVGQQWQMDVRLKKPNGLSNPGAFDYEQWLYQHRILATGYVRDGFLLSDDVQPDLSVLTSLAILRQQVSERMDTVLRDYPYKGLVKALSIGFRNDIDKYHWRVFMRTGTNHLMAISGLHIGLIAALVWFLVHALWKSWSTVNIRIPAYYVASLAALLAAMFYAALAGFAVPTQRALIMLNVAFLAIMLKRSFSPSYVLLLALLIVLLIDPLSPLSPGFWLSFCAVAVILFTVSSRLAPESNRQSHWLQLGRIQWSVFIGLLPLLVLLFHQTSLIAPLANSLAVPFMSLVIVPLVLLASLFLFVFEPVSLALFSLLKGLLDILFWLLQPMSNWSESVFFLPELTWIQFVLVVVASIWLLMPNGWHGRWLGLLLLCPVLLGDIERPQEGDVHMTVLDVGQGLSMLLQTRNHTLLYDTGDKYSERFNMADGAIIPFLRLRGIQRLDTLIVSHSDRDHAGSINELLAQVPVSTILTGEPSAINVSFDTNFQKTAKRPVNKIRQCLKGQQWRWDNVEFKVLSPQNPLNGVSSNNRSCVILVTTASKDTLLLTGDIEKNTEKQLLANYPELKVRILQVPHHGSRTSSSIDFLQGLQPEIALFSYGYRNRFKHPARKVVERYKQMQVKLYHTSNGAIDIKRDLTNNSLLIKQFRFENRRFWHREPEQL